jgi:murein DD-endopeptidase MepM/ murein hydrolase activator NlpD
MLPPDRHRCDLRRRNPGRFRVRYHIRPMIGQLSTTGPAVHSRDGTWLPPSWAGGQAAGMDYPYDPAGSGPCRRRRRCRATRSVLAATALLGGLALVVPAAMVDPGPPAGAAVTGRVSAERYRWPLDGQVEVARPFEPPARRWLPGHRGVDLVASPDAVVWAAGSGVVRFAGPVAGRGVVSIDHPGGLRTTYEPLTPLVSAGDPVAAGDLIGLLTPGHAGCPVAACLHWGLRRGEHYLDPLALLGLGRVRLLPHW